MIVEACVAEFGIMLSGHNVPWCSIRKVMKMEFFLPLRVDLLSSITASVRVGLCHCPPVAILGCLCLLPS